MEQLIVGIDPGTTTGLAVFSLEGKLLATESRRGFSRAAIRTFILGLGKPLIIGSDMRPLPRSIWRIAASFSSRSICPEGQLTRKDKRRIAGDFLKTLDGGKEPPWKNQHEKDALVAGWYAWKRVRVTVEKLEKLVGEPRLRKQLLASALVEGRNVKQYLNGVPRIK